MNVQEQIAWAYRYIRDRYGIQAPTLDQFGWYARGGSLPAGLMLVRNDSDEPEEVRPREAD